MVDRLLTPRTPDRVFLPAGNGNGDEEVVLLDEAFIETPRTVHDGRGDEDDTKAGGQEVIDAGMNIRTGRNGILLTPGDEERKGLMGLGIVCLDDSIKSSARRRVLSFSRRFEEEEERHEKSSGYMHDHRVYDNIDNEIRTPDQQHARRPFHTKHERYRTTSSAYALPFPTNSYGRTYRRRMGKYPFNNPFARILFFSTAVILLAALFGIGGLVQDIAELEGTEFEGWVGGDEGQVFGLGGLATLPSDLSGRDAYKADIDRDYTVGALFEETKLDYDKHYEPYQRESGIRRAEKRGWRAKFRDVGAMLCTTSDEQVPF